MAMTEEAPARGAGRVAAALRSGPLSVPGFRLLTFGQFASTIGDYCYAVALPWLVLSGGGSAASLGIVLACYGIPRAVLTVPGGSLVDRVGPRVVMLGADTVRCAATSTLAVLAASQASSLTVLCPVAAVFGACSGVFSPAALAIMPSLVDSKHLTSANAVYTSAVQIGSLLGPVLGGILVAAVGPATGFAVDAGSFLASAATLALIGRTAAGAASTVAAEAEREPGAVLDAGVVGRAGPAGLAEAELAVLPGSSDGPAEAELAGLPRLPDGRAQGAAAGSAAPAPASVRVLLRHAPMFQVLLLLALTANFALTGTTEVALPSLAHARFGADGFGAILACLAAATLAGAIVVTRLAGRFRPIPLIAGSCLVAAAAVAAVPFLGGLPGAAACMAVCGLALGFDNVLSVTVIQRWAPPALLGRVVGLVILAGAGSFPLSAFVAGLLTRHLGPAPVFPIAGALFALSMLYGLSRREFRDFGAEPEPADG